MSRATCRVYMKFNFFLFCLVLSGWDPRNLILLLVLCSDETTKQKPAWCRHECVAFFQGTVVWALNCQTQLINPIQTVLSGLCSGLTGARRPRSSEQEWTAACAPSSPTPPSSGPTAWPSTTLPSDCIGLTPNTTSLRALLWMASRGELLSMKVGLLGFLIRVSNVGLCNSGDYSQNHLFWNNPLLFMLLSALISRVPDQNGVSQAWYIVEIHHSGQKPSIYEDINYVPLPLNKSFYGLFKSLEHSLICLYWSRQLRRVAMGSLEINGSGFNPSNYTCVCGGQAIVCGGNWTLDIYHKLLIQVISYLPWL